MYNIDYYIKTLQNNTTKIGIIIVAFIINFIIFFSFPVINYMIEAKKRKNVSDTKINLKVEKIAIQEEKKKEKKKITLKDNQPKRSQNKADSSRFKLKLGISGGEGAAIQSDDLQNIVYNENEVDIEPVVIREVKPDKPSAADAAGISGYVELEIIIDEQGNVASVKVIESTEGYGFKEAAITAMWQFKFRPASIKKIPVRVRRSVLFNFE